MRIPIDEIHEGGCDVSFSHDEARFGSMLRDARTAGGDVTGSATLHLESWPNRVDVSGSLTASLPMQCVRCLNPFRQTLDREILQILVRSVLQEEDEVDEDGAELSSRDLDRTELVGDAIDLESLLNEEIELGMPMKALCSEDCKGICAGCGAELNTEPCTCEPAVDPRWELLKGLKLKE